MAKTRRPPARQAKASSPGRAGNPLVQAVAALSESDRKSTLANTHPLYTEHKAEYRLNLDAYEGSGGFLNGDYLWQYSNEKDADFEKRQKQARYHNYFRGLVNIYARHVYRAGVKRDAKNLAELKTWWENVDGAGTPIDAFMKRGAKLALSAGIAGALVDKETADASGPAKADEKARVIASWFPAPSILDWDLRHGELVGVKLLEMAARASVLDAVPEGKEAVQYLLWTREAWARFDVEGDVVGQSDGQALGMVPLAVVRPDPSAEHPFLGHPLAGNGNVFRALYNRCSEEDEILRDQAFSQLVVSVPPDGDVAEVKRELGNDIGTTTAIVSKGTVDYVTADMAAPEQIRKNIEFLVKEIYRMAHVRFERDSLDAESGEALRLQYTELNEMLANLAQVLEDAERQIAKCWFLWTHPGDRDANERAFAEAGVTIAYDREFFVEDLLIELEKWAKAIQLDLGLEFEHYAKKRVVDQIAPELPQVVKDKIHAEIEKQIPQREQAVLDAQARFAAGAERLAGGKKPEPPKPGEQDDKAA